MPKFVLTMRYFALCYVATALVDPGVVVVWFPDPLSIVLLVFLPLQDQEEKLVNLRHRRHRFLLGYGSVYAWKTFQIA